MEVGKKDFGDVVVVLLQVLRVSVHRFQVPPLHRLVCVCARAFVSERERKKKREKEGEKERGRERERERESERT